MLVNQRVQTLPVTAGRGLRGAVLGGVGVEGVAGHLERVFDIFAQIANRNPDGLLRPHLK